MSRSSRTDVALTALDRRPPSARSVWVGRRLSIPVNSTLTPRRPCGSRMGNVSARPGAVPPGGGERPPPAGRDGQPPGIGTGSVRRGRGRDGGGVVVVVDDDGGGASSSGPPGAALGPGAVDDG